MLSRRKICQYFALSSTALLLGHNSLAAATLMSSSFYMPDEAETHACTWMCFIASDEIWHPSQIAAVQANLVLISTTIAQYEPVNILVRKQDYHLARQQLEQSSSRYPIRLIESDLDDLWLRDTGPSFVINKQGQKAAINFNFNGWGNKQTHTHDAKLASFIASQASVPLITSTLSLEGGCFEVDGHGTAIMTESCIINDNRNPNHSKQQIEAELKHLLGLTKIIWLKGIKGKDITDGHTDFYARFARQGVVVVSRESYRGSYDYQITRDNIKTLQSATDADGNLLELIIIDTPNTINTQFGTQDFAAGYIGYYVCNGAVIMQKFADKKADKAARNKIQQAFPNHKIEQISVDAIASGGGSIHCTTQQEPKS